jgi:hypothetical protein
MFSFFKSIVGLELGLTLEEDNFGGLILEFIVSSFFKDEPPFKLFLDIGFILLIISFINIL